MLGPPGRIRLGHPGWRFDLSRGTVRSTDMARRLPDFTEAYVISDLHIGGPSGRQMFTATKQLVAFLKHVTARAELVGKKPHGRLLLVINGDFVDFLAQEKATDFQGSRSQGMLDDILLEQTEFAAILPELQAFVAQPSAHLVITLGNHDVELALPDTRQRLLDHLTQSQPSRLGQVELSFDGWGYRFQVGGRAALCLHGNETDPFNFTRYDELDRIVHELMWFDGSEFGEEWRPSAGSWFVWKAINPLKQRYPFVDLLKPELPLAATVLAILDPTKAPYLSEAVRMATGAAGNELTRPASQRRMLSMGPQSSGRRSELNAKRRVEMEVEEALQNGTIDDLIAGRQAVKMLGWTDWWTTASRMASEAAEVVLDGAQKVRDELVGAARDTHLRALRAAVRPLAETEPYHLRQLSTADQKLDDSVRQGYDVVFAGHTHFRRLAPRRSGKGLHINTGTWAGLIGFSRELVDSPKFADVYDALRSPDRQKLLDLEIAPGVPLVREECTFARIQGKGDTTKVALGSVAPDGSLKIEVETGEFGVARR